MPSSTFTYVKIPAKMESPIEEITASTAGGLEHDELVSNARTYFQKEANAEAGSCDIMALTIPLEGNNFRAVSLYASDFGVEGTQENQRATQLVTACGHALPEAVRGDVFVGRAYDNEVNGDAWERLDFTVEDADPTAQWCRTARSSGGGGGHGGSASSLNSLVKSQLSPSAEMIGAGPKPMYGMDGAPPVEEEWGTWTQSEDELELKLMIPAGIKPKIVFKRNLLSIGVQNETKLEGALFAPIVPDECTYTMESVGDQKELCVTITKAETTSGPWSWLTVAK